MRSLTTLPWLRAPLLLLRQPGLLLAIAAGAFVAVLPAAGAPLFLSSARSAALHNQLDNTCPAKVGLHLQSRWGFRTMYRPAPVLVDPAAATAEYAGRRASLARETATTPGLSTPVTTLYAATSVRSVRRGGVERVVPGDEAPKFWLAGRSDDVANHVEVRQGPSGRGLWLPESFASEHGLAVGDEIETTTLRLTPGIFPIPADPDAPRRPVRVAAVYADLGTEVVEPYWCTLQGLYGYTAGGAQSDPEISPVVFTDLDTMVSVGVGSTLNIATEYVDIALADERPTASRAHATASGIAGLRKRIDPVHRSGGTVGPPVVITSLGHSAERAELVHRTLRDTTAPATGAGVLIGLVVVAAAAVYWVQRREREVRLLAAHGVSSAALAVKAALEALAALTVGAAGALGAAWALVLTFGPSRTLSGEAGPWALGLAVAGWGLVVLVTAACVGYRVRRMIDVMPSRHRSAVARVPWELLLAAAAAALWWMLDDTASVDRPGGLGSVAHVPLRLVVVPVLGFVAVVVLTARLGAWWVRRRRAGARAGSRVVRPGVFLALRRIARPVAASALLGAVTAIPVAMTGFGATVTGSIRLTLEAKSAVVLGSDTVASLDRPVDVPAALADRATAVLRLGRVLVGAFETDVIGVDPASFPRGAFWHPQLPGPDLANLVSGLRNGPEPTGIAYGALPAGQHDVRIYGERRLTVSVTTTRLLPGSQGGYPVLLVHRDALGELARYAVPELWIRGDPHSAARELDRAGLPIIRLAQTTGAFGDSLYEPVTYTFQYLIALNVFAGLVVAAGLLLYVEARAPVYRRGYVVLRRFGLRRRAHLAALVLETALPMGTGLAFGLLIAAVAAWTSRADLDLAAGSPPGPLIAVPGGVLVAMLGTVAAVALTAAAFAQFRVVRAKPGEVLREF